MHIKLLPYLFTTPAVYFTANYLVCIFKVGSPVQGIWLTDRISNSRQYEKCGSIPLYRAIMKERLRWLGYVLLMKDDRLPKIVLFGNPSGAKQKAGRPRLGWEYFIKKDLKEMGTFWEGVKREALSRLGWKRSLRSCLV